MLNFGIFLFQCSVYFCVSASTLLPLPFFEQWLLVLPHLHLLHLVEMAAGKAGGISGSLLFQTQRMTKKKMMIWTVCLKFLWHQYVSLFTNSIAISSCPSWCQDMRACEVCGKVAYIRKGVCLNKKCVSFLTSLKHLCFFSHAYIF